jgi:deoxyribodipyrimidine photolyase
MDTLKFLNDLTREANSAHVPTLRVFEAKSADAKFDKEVERIAHMVTTIARASKNSTEEVWKLLEQHMRKKGVADIGESLKAAFENTLSRDKIEPYVRPALVNAKTLFLNVDRKNTP